MSTLRSFRFLAPVVALSLLAWAPVSARAEMSASTGTISGKVVEESGTPASNVHVKLFAAKEKKNKDAAEVGDKSDKKPKKEAVAETTTDKDGAFTLSDVAPGYYTIAAGGKGAMAREKVEVSAGKSSEVKLTIKASAEKPKKDKKEKVSAN